MQVEIAGSRVGHLPKHRNERRALQQRQLLRLLVVGRAVGIMQRVGGGLRMERHDARLMHEQLRRGIEQHLPDGLWRKPLLQHLDDGLARVILGHVVKSRAQVRSRTRIVMSLFPGSGDLVQALAIESPRTVLT